MAFDAKARATRATEILQIGHASSMPELPNKSKLRKNCSTSRQERSSLRAKFSTRRRIALLDVFFEGS